MGRVLAALFILSVLSATAIAQAPLCDGTCSPDPHSSGYGNALQVRTAAYNARGGTCDPFSSGGRTFNTSAMRGLGAITKTEDATFSDSTPLRALVDRGNFLNGPKQLGQATTLSMLGQWYVNVQSWF
jgi:hypothetical protein